MIRSTLHEYRVKYEISCRIRYRIGYGIRCRIWYIRADFFWIGTAGKGTPTGFVILCEVS